MTVGVGPWLLLLGAVGWAHFQFTAFGGANCWTDFGAYISTPATTAATATLLYGGIWLLGFVLVCVTLSAMPVAILRPASVTLLAAFLVALTILIAAGPLHGQYMDALERVCSATAL